MEIFIPTNLSRRIAIPDGWVVCFLMNAPMCVILPFFSLSTTAPQAPCPLPRRSGRPYLILGMGIAGIRFGRAVELKLKSYKTLEKITKTMKMVASAAYSKAEKALNASRR